MLMIQLYKIKTERASPTINSILNGRNVLHAISEI